MALLEPGQEFAGYQIVEIAGEGGMAVVYRAVQPRLKRTVALKLIAPELARDAEFRTRFSQESETAASIEHPNVIPIYDSGDADGALYLAMRFIDGPDLRTLIEQEGALDPMRAAQIVEQMAAALDAAHENGLVHRDVKPQNTLISDQYGRDHVYLTDFGLSKNVAGSANLTKTGHWVGTVNYISPEQIEGRPLDARADVYSLGCVLFECLTGEVPFGRDSDMARLLAHLNDPAPLASERRSGVTPQFDKVIGRALSKSPEDRYPSAGDLGRAAAAAAEGRSADAPEVSVAAGAAAPTEAAGGRSRTAPARTRLRRRKAAEETAAAAPRARPAERPNRRALSIAGAAILAIAVVAVLVAVLAGGGGSSSSEAAAPDPDSGSAPKPAADGNGIVPGSALVGVWQGTAHQYGPQSTTYPVVMDIAPEPAADGSSGTINYPSFPCGGRVTIVDTGTAPIGTRYELDEEITRNLKTCTGGHITADLQGSELRWHWQLDDYNAFAVMRRLDAPPVEKRVHPELSVSDLELIDGRHEGTLTEYGPGTEVSRFPVILDITSSDQPLAPGSVVGLTVNPQGGCRGELRLIEQYDRVLVFRETPSGRGASRCLFYDRLEIVPWGDELVIRGTTVAPKTLIDGVLHAVPG